VTPPSDIERLITLGLNRYGAGDIDGALVVWREALAIDPDNEQANSYVSYVQANYDTLSSGEHEVTQGDESPFGIEEEPEYQIEVVPGELVQRDTPPFMLDHPADPIMFDDAATQDSVKPLRSVDEDPEVEELEIEAEEPPMPEISFEDATREYHGTRKPEEPPAPVAVAHNEFDDTDFSETAGTSEYVPEQYNFQPEGTPVGFSNENTEIRKRDLGFVQPTGVPVADAPSVGNAPRIDNVTLGEGTGERDLLAGLPAPGPGPAGKPNQAEIETQEIPFVSSTKAITKETPDGGRPPSSSKAITKELPDPKRSPARRDSAELSQAEVMLPHSPTQDFAPKIDIGAPTRELGIRPPPRQSELAREMESPIDDDTPTRALRGVARPESANEHTKSDIVLPFDPIDARAAQILDEIDAAAPSDEPHDDRTRRRINSLLERAVAWNQTGETERAVCAVDLAISEDPNSALGQKLITRNRETIMGVFQGYLGDLDRQPQLAKPLHELSSAPISPRAAFLLSRIDGTLTIDELLDVSGMPRLEAYRHLCQLFLRGILR
jgi:hypothetical protein